MSWKSIAFCVFVMLFLFGADAALKAYVHHQLPLAASCMPLYPFGGIEVFRNWHGIDFCLVHVMNKGAAWGIFSSVQDYLLYVRVALIGGLIAYLIFAKASRYRKWSLLLVTVGALSNVVDYFVYGHVVDMFYFILWGYSYPVFNIADSIIFLGIVLLLAEALVSKSVSKKSPKPKERKSS